MREYKGIQSHPFVLPLFYTLVHELAMENH